VTIYERYAQRQDDPAFQAALAAPATHLGELRWLIGDWRTTSTVLGAEDAVEESVTHFRLQGDSMIFSDDLSTVLVYDGFAGRWLTAGFEPPAAAMTHQMASAAWDGRTLVFEGEVTLLGERVTLRQTMTKISDDEFDLLNEQRVSGRFTPVDRYHYVRAPRG
jgi:hypothetical protein